MSHGTRAFALLVLALAATGCGAATSYVPRHGSRVSVAMQQGHYVYIRDGKEYPGGIFGDEIEEAVHGNPQAEEYARKYKAWNTGGFVLTWTGAATALAGSAVLIDGAGQNPNSQSLSGTETAGLVMAGSGLLVELIGIVISSEREASPVRRDQCLQRRSGLCSGQ